MDLTGAKLWVLLSATVHVGYCWFGFGDFGGYTAHHEPDKFGLPSSPASGYHNQSGLYLPSVYSPELFDYHAFTEQIEEVMRRYQHTTLYQNNERFYHHRHTSVDPCHQGNFVFFLEKSLKVMFVHTFFQTKFVQFR